LAGISGNDWVNFKFLRGKFTFLWFVVKITVLKNLKLKLGQMKLAVEFSVDDDFVLSENLIGFGYWDMNFEELGVLGVWDTFKIM